MPSRLRLVVLSGLSIPAVQSLVTPFHCAKSELWNIPQFSAVSEQQWPRRQSLGRERRKRSQLSAGPAPPLSTAVNGNSLVRIVFLRTLAFVHCIAFLIAFRQNKGLIGDHGIQPARYVLNQAEERGRIKRERRLAWREAMKETRDRDNQMNTRRPRRNLLLGKRIQQALGHRWDRYPILVHMREVLWDRSDRSGRPTTTLLWLVKDRTRLNPWLDLISIAGITLSTFILFRGAANVPLVATLWVLQKSLMNVGGAWYRYGWEPQLAELSFHALFLVPILSLNPVPPTAISPLVQWTLKWHLFRVMMGAGLIKLRSGDPKWKDWTATCYFYETQPVPNPISRYIHWMPRAFHKFEVGLNHFVELVAPWLLILPGLPKTFRRVGGLIQIAFQVAIISTGNLSFLNWLTMVPAFMCLDDDLLGRFFSPSQRSRALAVTEAGRLPLAHRLVGWLFFALILKLSIPVVQNLLSRKQIMNASYDPLRLVNSYGAFGRVGERREEWIISARTESGDWKEYEFHVKPGNVRRPPRFLSPYHHRIDWQMWLAANLKYPDRSNWIFPLLIKLLQSDPEVGKLVAFDPFENATERPKYIKIDAYRYEFHRPVKGEKEPPYWDRSFVAPVYPLKGLADFPALEALVGQKR